jgi:hypothetical protein
MSDQAVTWGDLAEVHERIAEMLRERQTPTAIDRPLISAGDSPSPLTEGPRRPGGSTLASGLRSWTKVGDIDGQYYNWASGREDYDPFEHWRTDDGGVPLESGLGYVAAKPGADYYGHPRGYWVAHEMVNGRMRRPIAVFIEGDEPTDLVAVIRGNGPGGRSMYDPGDQLPTGYDDLTVDVFRHRVNGPQAFGKLAIVAENADRQAMLNHTAIQVTLR